MNLKRNKVTVLAARALLTLVHGLALTTGTLLVVGSPAALAAGEGDRLEAETSARPLRHLWGRLVDAEAQAPLAGVVVSDEASGQQAVTDGLGRFYLPVAGERLVIDHPGYRPIQVQVADEGVLIGGDTPPAVARPLVETGLQVALERLPALVALPKLPRLLESAVALGWNPDLLGERFVASDGATFGLGGGRFSQGELDLTLGGAHAIGMLSYVPRYYSLQRGDTQEIFQRWQHQAELAVMYRHAWDRLALAAGPALLLDHTAVVERPLKAGRERDYLDDPLTRLAAGLSARAAWALPFASGLTLDAAAGAWPWSFTGQPEAGQAWAAGGHLGLSWWPWDAFGLTIRCQHLHWQGGTFQQAHQGMRVGVVYGL